MLSLHTYSEAISYLYGLQRFGMLLEMETITELLHMLGDPQQSFRSIHVAGTKGKGSVCTFISSILQAAGFKVGLYTSPHLINITERIRVNNREIEKKEIVRLLNQIIPKAEKLKKKYREPTFFETVTALGFKYFEQKKIDFGVIEVGLGGRLDATNVVNPLVSVITNIDYEHTEVLGNTISKIAAEKAGIIKENGLVVTATRGEGLRIIRKVCHEKNADLFCLLNQNISDVRFRKNGMYFSFRGLQNYRNLYIPVFGEHQVNNAALAILTTELLAHYGIKISAKKIRLGLRNSFISGRFEVLGCTPIIVADCAHTPGSARILRKTVEQYRIITKFKRVILVIGISGDKDISGIMRELLPVADIVIATRSMNPRAAEPEKLLAVIGNKDVQKKKLIPDIRNALECAQKYAEKDDLVLVTGSAYVVGEALAILKRKPKDDYLYDEIRTPRRI